MKDNIRLAFISNFFGIGGVPKTFLNIAENLSSNGFEFHFISPGSDEFQHKFLETGRCFYSTDPRDILSYLSSNKIDIVQTINCDDGNYLAMIAGVPRIIERQDGMTSAFSFDKTPVDCIISSTNLVYEKTKIEYPHKKVELIYNGVDTAVFAPADSDTAKKRALGINDGDTVIGYCGRISREKCLDKLIYTIYKIITDNKIQSVKLIIMGNHHQDGYLEYLKTITAPLEKNVIFLQPSETPQDIMRVFDIGVLCSGSYKDKSGEMKTTQEGLPNSIMEMMAMGIPVVATDSGETSSLVYDGQTGFLVTINDLFSFRKKLVELIKNPQLRKVLGNNARDHVTKNYNIETMIMHYESLYRSVISKEFIKKFPDTRKNIETNFITRQFEWNKNNSDSPSFLIIRSGRETLFDYAIDDIRWHFKSPNIYVLCRDEHKNLYCKRNIRKTFVYGESDLFDANLMKDTIEEINSLRLDYAVFLINDLIGKNYGNIYDIVEKIHAENKIVINSLLRKYVF